MTYCPHCDCDTETYVMTPADVEAATFAITDAVSGITRVDLPGIGMIAVGVPLCRGCDAELGDGNEQ